MLKQLPIKKEYLLVGATALLLLICYQLAFKKTVELWRVNSQLKAKVTQTNDLSYQPACLARKNNNLGKIIAKYKADTSVFRSNIINDIASIAEKEHVKLSEVPVQSPLYHTDQFIIQKLSFDGSFFALTKVLNQLQAASGIGMVRSVNFKTTENRSNTRNSKKLVLEVYVEIVNI